MITALWRIVMGSLRCIVVSSGRHYQGQQGFAYLEGLTGATTGSRGICMTILTIPPGARAKTHAHSGIETAAYVIEGEIEMFFGERLGERLVAEAGEYVYVPADVPHLVLNRSNSTCRALVAHTSPDDQTGIVLHPELDPLV
jgi:uncharacterized RmlC-like cupin family protein